MILEYARQTQALAADVAVLPLASIEAHGPHLPLGTDALIVEGILARAAEQDQSPTRIVRLPTLWLGASQEHADRTGTLSAEPEALIAAILAVGEGLARAGLRRMVLFNGHGGNVAAAGIAALKLRRVAMFVASIHWLDFGLPEGLTPPAPVKDDIHGGWIETAVMLHLAPGLVGVPPAARTGTAPAPMLFPQGPLAWGWMTSDLAPGNEAGPGGWVGAPALATPALGQKLVDYAAARLIDALVALAQAPWDKSP